MKLSLSKTAALAALILTGLSASAASFTDINTYAGKGQYIDTFSPFTDSFDIRPAFNPATMDVVSGSVKFYFNDDGDRDLSLLGIPINQEFVVIDFGSFDLLGDLGVIEVNFGTQLGGSVTGSILAELQGGTLTYHVRSLGDLYLTSARLDVMAVDTPATRVPDGGTTMALLGASLLGLVAFSRRK